MKAMAIDEYGGPEVLTAHDLPEPEPGPGQVRVEVAAAAVNPVDLGQRSGAAKGAMADVPFPIVLGWDVVGVVDALGEGATRFAVGDRVIGMSLWFATKVGTYAERLALDEAAFAAAPAGIDDARAVGLPLNGLTAWSALAVGKVQPGERLLVLGAAGGVGALLVQLAAARGIEVVGLGRPADLDALRRFGAAEAVSELGAVRGIDVAVDTTGTPDLALEVMEQGRLLTLAGKPAAVKEPVAVRAVGVRTDPDALGELAAMAASGTLELRVADTLPLADAAEAHRRMTSGRRGAMVLVP